LELRETLRLVRVADALTHSVTRVARTLERRQVRLIPFRDVRPVQGLTWWRWTGRGAGGRQRRWPGRRRAGPRQAARGAAVGDAGGALRDGGAGR